MRSIDRRRAIFPGRDAGGGEKKWRKKTEEEDKRSRERERERKKRRKAMVAIPSREESRDRNENRLIVARSGLTVFQSG